MYLLTRSQNLPFTIKGRRNFLYSILPDPFCCFRVTHVIVVYFFPSLSLTLPILPPLTSRSLHIPLQVKDKEISVGFFAIGINRITAYESNISLSDVSFVGWLVGWTMLCLLESASPCLLLFPFFLRK